MASSDVEHWQCDKTLPQCMTHMLENEIMCDVTFLLGEQRLEVHAHKYMLASRSPVFHAMLDGPMAERGKIEIPDIENGVFDVFLRYVYTDNVSVTVDNVLKVMYVSKKYCVDLLTKQCKDFVKKNITNESACVLMDSASMLQEEEIYKLCLEKIKENAESCIRSPGFTTLGKETLKLITESDSLVIKEEVLYEQVMKWCDAECRRQQMEITWENKRNLLGEVLFNIRFPLMDSKFFAKEISEIELLTDKEKVAIMHYHLLETPSKCSVFNHKERSSEKMQKVIRFSTLGSGWGYSGQVDAIGFKTSHDSRLFGILLYGSTSTSCNYTVKITVTDSDGCIHNTTETEIVSDSEIEMHEIKFETPVYIQAYKSFRVELLMTGSQSRSGLNGESRVSYANGLKEVTFFNSYPSPNCTDVFDGQIPGLLLM
ncbi:hypothetical protein FSP39_024838 [Pinctada imbricata]|uniref:BTB domain-containing protein n=1 Tax=Pinctada imbricata TaxID=66713 RepID=A0AA88YR99_PINIB|nr:hypothetical protein FSP39_024838 [Pinctada imbricata]